MEQHVKKLKVSIKTLGCQMNIHDSEVAAGLLQQAGFALLQDDQGINKAGADVVLMNTCSVRDNAERRVFGRLEILGKEKKRNPELVVGLMGCMVEEHRELLFKKYPQIDLMVGTRNIKELPVLIEEVRRTRKQVARIKQDGISIEYTDQIKRQGKFHAWLPIMTGCNKVCTFCIVPVTRGEEVSMPAREVYREASRLVSEGVKWITLLGQNVNSYRGGFQSIRTPEHQNTRKETNLSKDSAGAPAHERTGAPAVSFPALLDMLCQIEGLERISFTTSHPHDATEELFQTIARNPKISRRFHLPLQSGSNRILKRMKRLHTYEEYKAKIDRMRELIPDVVLSTDIIVGFSGESEADHLATARALAEMQYESAYIYKYSLRPSTPASKMADDVPRALKEKRNEDLLEVQGKISAAKKKECIGRTFEVFVDGPASRDPSMWQGCARDERRVVFSAAGNLEGTFQRVKIMSLSNSTLLGEVVQGQEPAA